jgi:hypothetical protein
LKEVDLMITVVKTRSGEVRGGEVSGVVDEFNGGCVTGDARR